MGFIDFLFPPSTSLYPPAATVLTYLESFTDHFNLQPHIHFNTSVISAEYVLNEALPSGKKAYVWNISTQSMDCEPQISHFKFDWLLVCNGHYSVPRCPSIPGLQAWLISGKASHSATYRNPSQLPLPSSAKVLVIGNGPSGQDIVTDLLSSPLISQIIHSTSTPPTIPDVNPKLINRPRVSQFFTDSTVQFCDSSIESSISYCILATGFQTHFPFFSDDYLCPSIPPSIPPLPDMSILYNTSYGVFPLARYLFPFIGTTHRPYIAFPGLPIGVSPFPLTQIQARAALALFEEIDQDPENSKIDWAQESLDILTRYEELKMTALEPAAGDLNLNSEISEASLTLEEKIAKKWYRFEPMDQFEYRDSLIELVGRLSSTSLLSSSGAVSSSPSSLPSASPSPNPNLNLNSSGTPSAINAITSLDATPRSSNPLSRFLSKDWERYIITYGNILRRTWQALERSGEAKEWVRGVGEGEDPEKEWVELTKKVVKKGLEMEG